MTVRAQRLQEVLASRDLTLAAGNDSGAICRSVTRRCMDTLAGADSVAVTLFDRGRLVCHDAAGVFAGGIGQFIPDRTFAALGLRARRGLVYSDVSQEAAVDRACYHAAGVRSAMTVPLMRPEGPIGALTITSSRLGMFDAADLLLAEVLAGDLVQGLAQAAAPVSPMRERDGRAHFAAITGALPQFVWTMSRDGLITYANRPGAGIGRHDGARTIWEAIPRHVHPADRDAFAAMCRDSLASGLPGNLECRLILPTGIACWHQVQLVADTRPGGGIGEWIGVASNIDDRKGAEIAMQETVHGTLLRLYEVNHRVKNSLQIATGLLVIQASRVRDPEARRRLMDTRAQLATIAKIHQAAYRSGEHDRVEVSAILHELAEGLIGAGHRAAVRLEMSVPRPLALPVDQAVPILLITSELLANALKHAMTGCEGGSVSIRLEVDDDRIVLDVLDDGPGLPAGYDLGEAAGLGFEIVRGLAEQVGGRVELVPAARGAHFRTTIPRFQALLPLPENH